MQQRTDPPHCPNHQGIEMKLVNSAEPLFSNYSLSGKGKGKARAIEAEKRMIWRCPVEGCYRVESVEERYLP